MHTERLQCGKREYILEARITKNGHKYLMITERSSGRSSKVILFHDHFEVFRSAMERAMSAEPQPASAAVAGPEPSMPVQAAGDPVPA